MTQLDARQDYPQNNNNRNKTNWYIWIVVAIVAILILWLALDSRTDLNRPEQPATTPPAQPEITLHKNIPAAPEEVYLLS